MGGYKLQKDLVFFHPGKPGSVFTLKVGTLMTEKILREVLDHLKHVTGKKVDWIEDRRRLPRS
jgi:hypothetical protein